LPSAPPPWLPLPPSTLPREQQDKQVANYEGGSVVVVGISGGALVVLLLILLLI